MVIPPRFFVVMGVAGCGKSTVAALLAARLGWPFTEGDLLHPPTNLAKMRAGIPLQDSDRDPWLNLVAEAIQTWRAAGRCGVITCSALRHRYRAQIRNGADDICFVHLHGPPEIIAARLAARTGHFMPPSLLPSQFESLEPPTATERAITLDVTRSPEQLVETIYTENFRL